MKKIYFRILILSSFVSFSQDYDISMNITKKDLMTNFYSKDSTANALVVYEYGNSFFSTKTYKLTTEIKRKVKILSKKGLKKGNIEVVLYKNSDEKEKVKKIKGSSFELVNNQIIEQKLEKKSVFTEEYNDKIEIVKFLIPNVKVGSIITYSYTIESPFMSKYKEWYFQEENPKLYSEYNTSIPGNYEYNIRLIGNQELNHKENRVKKHCISVGNSFANCAEATYIMKDIPAYIDEAYSTTKNNYLSKIEYNLSVFRRFDGTVKRFSKTWKNVDYELHTDADFGQQLGPKKYSRNIIPQHVLGIANRKQKAEAIFQYIIDNYGWNGDSGRYNTNVKNLIKNKMGNAFELNLLLQNVLAHSGYKAYPILSATRDYGFPTKAYPVLNEYNYLILMLNIDGDLYFLDATDPYLSFGEIPYRANNNYGRLFNYENKISRWQDIEIKPYSINQIKLKLNLDENNLLKGNIENKKTGYLSYSSRKRYDENPSEYKKALKDKYEYAIFKNHKRVNKNKNDFEFIETADIELEEEFIGNKIFFNPFFIKFFDENPFKLSNRTYPIDFGYKQIFLYSVEVDLGNEVNVLDLPKNETISLPNNTGTILFNTNYNENKLTLFFKVKLNQPVYNATYYPYLKSFMSKIVEIQNNTIIALEKK